MVEGFSECLGKVAGRRGIEKPSRLGEGFFVLYASLASVAFAVVFGILVSGLLVL